MCAKLFSAGSSTSSAPWWKTSESGNNSANSVKTFSRTSKTAGAVGSRGSHGLRTGACSEKVQKTHEKFTTKKRNMTNLQGPQSNRPPLWLAFHTTGECGQRSGLPTHHDAVCVGRSISGTTRIPRSRAYSTIVRTSDAAYFSVAENAPMESSGTLLSCRGKDSRSTICQ